MDENYNDYGEDDFESGVSDDAFEQSPVLTKYQTQQVQQDWIDELTAARKERQEWTDKGHKYIKRYVDSRDSGEQGKSYYNIFFANTEIKLASLYARTPKPDIKRRFDDPDDQVSRVAGQLLERNIAYELECDNFDQAIRQILFDRLVPGMGVGWLRLEQEIGEPKIDPATGQPIPGSASVFYENAAIDYVAWDDFVWAPCRVWSECRWVSRRIPMCEAAVKDRFADTASELTLQELSYSKKNNGTVVAKNDALKPRNQVEPTTDIVEIWDKERKLIFWISESADVPLDVQEDTNEFPDFFPTPQPLARMTGNSSTIPVPDYHLVQDQYRELNELNSRCAQLTQQLQLRWVYNSSIGELQELYQTGGEGQGIPVKDWTALNEAGGLSGAIQFAPLDEIATTYQKLSQARDLVKAQIYEIEGISDILRGVSAPYVTAAAANQTASYSATRLTVAQNEVAKYIERLLRLKAHLICKFYQPQTIVARAGTPMQADVQLIPQALQLIKDKQFSHFRLQVSVDSIQDPLWNQEKGERTEFVNAITNLMGQMLPVVKQTPELAPLAITLVKFGVAGFKGAQSIEGQLDTLLQQFIASQSQHAAAPPQPSPEQMKLQAQQQVAQAGLQKTQMQEQTKQQELAADYQLRLRELDLREREVAVKESALRVQAQHNVDKLHIDQFRAVSDHANDVHNATGGQ